MAKASEKYSSVPDFIRDKFREYKQKEKDDETERKMKERENASPINATSESDRKAMKDLIEQGTLPGNSRLPGEATRMAQAQRKVDDAYKEMRPSMNPVKNIADVVSGRAGEQTSDYNQALRERDQTREETGYKKGGMVKKSKGGMVKKPKSTSRRGDGICTRGHTKGKMY
jgi:hypothetical protein